MKTAFWLLAVMAAGLLAVTISETQKLSAAYRTLNQSMALNAHVNLVLIKTQKQNLAQLQIQQRQP